MSEISCMQSQQNSAAHTVHVMWLQEPSSIFTMRAPQRGHAFISPSMQRIPQKIYCLTVSDKEVCAYGANEALPLYDTIRQCQRWLQVLFLDVVA